MFSYTTYLTSVPFVRVPVSIIVVQRLSRIVHGQDKHSKGKHVTGWRMAQCEGIFRSQVI